MFPRRELEGPKEDEKRTSDAPGGLGSLSERARRHFHPVIVSYVPVCENVRLPWGPERLSWTGTNERDTRAA